MSLDCNTSKYVSSNHFFLSLEILEIAFYLKIIYIPINLYWKLNLHES